MFNRRPATAAQCTLLALALCAGFAASADAATLSFGGRLDDPNNKALLSSDLSAATFDSAQALANNVAIYQFDLTQAGQVRFDSQGYAAGGLSPYFSIFSGQGLAASFVDSNYFSTGTDFHLSENLAAGHYTLTLGSNQNLSFAENYGRGTLGDGFTGLGDPSQMGNASYHFTVSTPTAAPVPEPTTLTLAMLGLACLGLWRKSLPRANFQASKRQFSLPA